MNSVLQLLVLNIFIHFLKLSTTGNVSCLLTHLPSLAPGYELCCLSTCQLIFVAYINKLEL